MSIPRVMSIPEIYRDDDGIGFKLETPLGFEVVYIAGKAEEGLAVGSEGTRKESQVNSEMFRRQSLGPECRRQFFRESLRCFADACADLALKWPRLRRGVLWLAGRTVR